MKLPGMVLGAMLILAAAGGKPVPSRPAQAPRNASRIITTTFGGTVVDVMVKAGENVKRGQLLLRLHAGEFEDRAARVVAAFEKTPLDDLRRGAAIIARIPPMTWKRLLSTDPEKLAAEQDYVAALSAHEQEPSRSTEQRLELASRRRIAAESGILSQDLFDTLSRGQHEEAGDIGWLRTQLKNGEMRSPVDGKVAIFDLHPGDTVAPNGRIMLIEAAQ